MQTLKLRSLVFAAYIKLSLTEHLHVVQHLSRAGGADAIISKTHVSARIALARSINQQVAEQESGVVKIPQVQAVFSPCDLWSGNPAGHTLQHKPLAFIHHNGAGCGRIDDTSRFRGRP